jgi:hypothetical protein
VARIQSARGSQANELELAGTCGLEGDERVALDHGAVRGIRIRDVEDGTEAVGGDDEVVVRSLRDVSVLS